VVVYTFGHGLQIWQMRKIKYLIVSTKDVRFFLLCLLSFLQYAEIIIDEIIMKLAEVWGFEFDNTDTFGVILECDIGVIEFTFSGTMVLWIVDSQYGKSQ